MTEPIFKMDASGVDVEKIVLDIRESVSRKIEEGVYADARVARAERTNLATLRSEDEFLEFYLKCLRDTVFVDINDFEIQERRRGWAPLLVGIKKGLWKLLKFYTYRLWSQQNQINGLLVTAIEGTDRKYDVKIRALEERIRALEAGRDRQQGDGKSG